MLLPFRLVRLQFGSLSLPTLLPLNLIRSVSSLFSTIFDLVSSSLVARSWILPLLVSRGVFCRFLVSQHRVGLRVEFWKSCHLSSFYLSSSMNPLRATSLYVRFQTETITKRSNSYIVVLLVWFAFPIPSLLAVDFLSCLRLWFQISMIFQSKKMLRYSKKIRPRLSPIPTISNEKDAETTSRESVREQKFHDSTFGH